jgi:hypothetical protein
MAITHVFEQRELTCTANHLGRASSATFTFYKDGVKLDPPVDVKLRGVLDKTGSAKFTPPACADGQQSYDLTYQIVVEGRPPIRRDETIRVWAKRVNVKATDWKTNAPVAGALARFGQPGTTRYSERRTADDGKVEHELETAGDFTVEWQRPARLERWTQATGRRREAVIELGFGATIYFPNPRLDPTGLAEHRQWVNLDADPDKPAQGAKIKLRVGPAALSRTAKEGDKVYLKAKFAATNSVRTKSAGHAPGADYEAEAALAKVNSRLEASFELELGPCGGDSVEVKVGGTSAASDDRVVIVNWRKLYYEIVAPSTMALVAAKVNGADAEDLPRDVRRELAGKLAKAFVAFELVGSHRFDATAATHAKRVYKAGFMRKTPAEKDLYVLSDTVSRPPGHTTTDKRAIRMTLCDASYVQDDVPPKAVKLELEAASGELHTIDVYGEAVFPTWMFDQSSDSIVPKRWRAVVDGLPADHPGRVSVGGAGRSGAVARDWLQVVDFGKVKVMLPSASPGDPGTFAGAPSPTTCPVEVAFDLHTAFGIGGSAGDGKQLLVLGPGDPAGYTAQVLCHELGHAMGQAVFPGQVKPSPGMAVPTTLRETGEPSGAGTVYKAKGHYGTHCAYGLSVDEKKRDSLSGLAGGCIMFGESGAGRFPGDYCDDCVAFIRARTLKDVVAGWSGRGDDDL